MFILKDIEQAKLVYQLFAEKLLSFGPVSAMNDTISISSALVAITSYSELLNRNTAVNNCYKEGVELFKI